LSIVSSNNPANIIAKVWFIRIQSDHLDSTRTPLGQVGNYWNWVTTWQRPGEMMTGEETTKWWGGVWEMMRGDEILFSFKWCN
jgi:hypothetical protein